MITRRDALIGMAGVTFGGLVAVAGGLSYREYRRARRIQPDPAVVEDDGWIMTESDRRELAAADRKADQLRTSEELNILDNTDIPGGDLRDFRADDLDSCISACEDDNACKAFTYARSDHRVIAKQKMCWLKGNGTSSDVIDADYISGRR